MRDRIRRIAAPVLPAIRWVTGRKGRRELERWLADISVPFGGFRDKVVLDVGTDLQGTLVRLLAGKFAPREMVGINLAVETRSFSPAARVERCDVRNMPYPADHFDVIISSSAFEHITGLEQGLAEMHRVLKPGGTLFSHFGPIWSTSYGHHLWTTHRGRVYTYWDVILPPFCHLLMTKEEIDAWLQARGHDPELSDTLSTYVTGSEEQNRLFFEDYEEMFGRSAFEIRLFKGYDHPTLAPVYNRLMTGEILEALKHRHPDRRHFFYDGITTLMRKRA